MTDFYQFMFGRPSPGRASRQRAFRYATSGETNTPEERAGTLPEAIDTEAADANAIGSRTRGRGGRYEGRNGPTVPEYPIGPGGITGDPGHEDLSGVIDGGNGRDFVSRMDEERRAALPSYLRAGADDTIDEPVGRAPRNPENVIADATQALPSEYTAARPTPLYEAHYRSRALPNGSHLRTTEPVFDRIPEPPQNALRPHSPTRQVDPTQEWIAAEERANVRWREGRQTPADMLFAVIYGHQRREKVAQENADMREEIRRR